MTHNKCLGLAAVLGLCWSSTHAGIYACIDAQGRRLSADRPIPECLDSTQRELHPNGSLKRIVVARVSAVEARQGEARQEEARMQLERDRARTKYQQALVERYKNVAAYERESQELLASVSLKVDEARWRLGTLVAHHDALAARMAKAPAEQRATLELDLNHQAGSIRTQARLLRSHEDELERLRAKTAGEMQHLQEALRARQGGAGG